MKKLLAFALAALVLLALCPAWAEAPVVVAGDINTQQILVGQQVKVPDVCSFTVQSVAAYDAFMGVDSGAAMTQLVLSVDLTNLQTQQMVMSRAVQATMTYDDELMPITPKLFADPVGRFMSEKEINGGTCYIDVFQCEAGTIRYRKWHYDKEKKEQKFSYEGAIIAGDGSSKLVFLPETFEWMNERGNYVCQPVGSKPSVLEPLVKRRYHFVFTVPDIIAKDDGLRTVQFVMGDRGFALTF